MAIIKRSFFVVLLAAGFSNFSVCATASDEPEMTEIEETFDAKKQRLKDTLVTLVAQQGLPAVKQKLIEKLEQSISSLEAQLTSLKKQLEGILEDPAKNKLEQEYQHIQQKLGTTLRLYEKVVENLAVE